MELLQTLFFTAVALGVLVTFHEFGHFWVARRCGVKVIRFSVGFGTPLLKWRDRHDTEFVIAALPLGGYVKMLDEREGDVAEQDLPYAFSRKSVWQRMAIVAAGPIANFLLAIAAYWIVFGMGVSGAVPVVDGVKEGSVAAGAGVRVGQEVVRVDGELTPTWQALQQQLVRRIGETGAIYIEVSDSPGQQGAQVTELTGALNSWLADVEDVDPIAGLGIELYTPKMVPLIDTVVEGGAASQAGFKAGDLLLKADGLLLESWDDWVSYVRPRAGQPVSVEFDRNGERLVSTVVPKKTTIESGETVGQVGMIARVPVWPEELIRKREYGVVGALGQAVQQTWSTSVLILDSVKKMLVGLISAKHLSGPITIAKVAGASAQYGLSAYLGFLALLSVSLGVLNLLPIPVLDGGHLAYYIVEAVKGSPVSEKIQMAGFKVGLFLVVGLMVLALYNDLMRL